MKTTQELIEKIKTDKAFAAEVKAKIKAQKDAGASNYVEALSKIAEELGYEVSEEEIKAFRKAQAEKLDMEQLDLVSGGGIGDILGCYMHSSSMRC